MSVETLPHTTIDLVQKPAILDAQSIGHTVLNWVQNNVPYDPFCNISSGQEGYEAGKASCFGQSDAVTIQIEKALGLNAGFCITASGESYVHSTAVSIVPHNTDALDKVIFLEPELFSEPAVIEDILVRHIKAAGTPNRNLFKLMTDTLPASLETGDFCNYYFIDPAGPEPTDQNRHKLSWKLKQTNGIRGGDRIKKDGHSFLVTDAGQGRNMLQAISILAKNYRKDRATYSELYPELIQFIPDFLYFPPPKGHA